MKTWIYHLGEKVEIFIPFLGYCRPPSRRCCQTCTPISWGRFYHQQLSSLGFRDVIRVTEEDTRYRGWLVRRVCGFLAVWDWEVPADTPRDLPSRICCSKTVRDVTTGRSRGSSGDSGSHWPWKEEILKILAEIQAPLSLLMLRLCNWALLKLLNCLFLNVQLHRGQLEMVLRASKMPDVPLVFLSTHKSPLDGLLLSFLLFSQGLGVPRVTVGGQACSSRLRALLSRLGGIFLPLRMGQMPSNQDEGLPGAVLDVYIEEVLKSQQPLLIFLEEPSVTQHLSAPAREWLALVYRAVRDGAIPDVLLVPMGIAYDIAPGALCREEAHGAEPLGLGTCLWAACQAMRRNFGCVRVDFAQPFSLQEFVAKNLVRQSCLGNLLEEPLLPTIRGTCPSQLDKKKAVVWGPGLATAASLEAEEEILVTKLGLHCLSDGVSCSAVMAVAITSVLLLHKHWEGVFFSRLMKDFAWLVEEILSGQHDVGFSGQVRVLVQHSLILLKAHITCYHLSPIGDIVVVPKASAEALSELSHHSAAILPIFAHEAVGACAIRALLVEMLPFLKVPVSLFSIVISRDELHRKTLELLRLLPLNLLGLQPCQPLDYQTQDVIDKLLVCGLLESEELESEHWGKGQAWARLDFSDSDSDSDSDSKVPRCFFKLSEPQGSPGFLFFLWRLLSPVLRTYTRAVAFLDRPSWPQPEAAYVEALLQFLAEEDSVKYPNRSLALSSLHAFKEMGVLEEVQTPAGPLLHLAQPFHSSVNRGKLEAFIQQFLEPWQPLSCQ